MLAVGLVLGAVVRAAGADAALLDEACRMAREGGFPRGPAAVAHLLRCHARTGDPEAWAQVGAALPLLSSSTTTAAAAQSVLTMLEVHQVGHDRAWAAAARDLVDRELRSPAGEVESECLRISALARSSQVLGSARDLVDARKAAGVLLRSRWDARARRMGRTERAQALWLQSVLDLYEASFEPDWLDRAAEAADSIRPRAVEGEDGRLPGAGSVEAAALLRFSRLGGGRSAREAAEALLARVEGRMRDSPGGLPWMLSAADAASAKPREVVIAGPQDDPLVGEMLRQVHSRFLPSKTLILVPDAATRERLGKRLPFVRGARPIKGRPTAYPCVDFLCEMPVTDPAALGRTLDGRRL